MEGDLNAKNIHLCFPSNSAKINTYTPQFLQQPPSYIHSQSFFLSFFPSKMNFKSVCVALRRRCVCIINNTARERDGKTQFRKVTFGWSKQAQKKLLQPPSPRISLCGMLSQHVRFFSNKSMRCEDEGYKEKRMNNIKVFFSLLSCTKSYGKK